MEYGITQSILDKILSREKKDTSVYAIGMFICLGIIIYCMKAFFTTLSVTGGEVSAFFWFILLFILLIGLLYFLVKSFIHLKIIKQLKSADSFKGYKVPIVDVDMTWGFDGILFRPVFMMELSWKEEDSLFLIETVKEKKVAEIVGQAFLLMDDKDNLISSYIFNEDDTIC